jgi:hypothetical protein
LLSSQDIWDKSYYWKDTEDENNPLRCIFRDEALRRTYFKNMSRAMAKSCEIFATVMTEDVESIPEDGIWYTVEYPTLQHEGKVSTILAITTDGFTGKVIWDDSNDKRAGKSSRNLAMMTAKRDECGTDRETAAAFNDDGDLPVNW